MKKGSKILVLWLYGVFCKKLKLFTIIRQKIEKKDFLQNESIKNPYYSLFYADLMQNTVFDINQYILRYKYIKSNGNDYLYLAFLAQKGEETDWER